METGHLPYLAPLCRRGYSSRSWREGSWDFLLGISLSCSIFHHLLIRNIVLLLHVVLVLSRARALDKTSYCDLFRRQSNQWWESQGMCMCISSPQTSLPPPRAASTTQQFIVFIWLFSTSRVMSNFRITGLQQDNMLIYSDNGSHIFVGCLAGCGEPWPAV